MRIIIMLFLVAAFNLTVAEQSRMPNGIQFDSLGPTVHQLTTKDGRKIHYIDDGRPGDIPVVFTGGLGTSVRAIRLLDFLRTMRKQLNLRFISVERNGFGQTAFNKTLTMSDYVSDVEQVLDHLKIGKFSLFGISGGGPYTAKIASRNVQRLRSVHMAATSPLIGDASWCENTENALGYRMLIGQPMQFFGFPSSSAMHQVEGFQDTAYDEAARAHFVGGQLANPAALDHEMSLYCKESLDTTGVTSKLYVYRGEADSLLMHEKPDTWRHHYSKASIIVRNYPREGHDVQYRHLDQILLDISNLSEDILICTQGKQQQVTHSELDNYLDRGAHLGLCLWQAS